MDGVVERFVIPNFCPNLFPSYPTIHYRSLVKPLLKAASGPTAQLSERTNVLTHAENHSNVKTTVPLRYDNIIERLEKKYCGSLDALQCSDDDGSPENPRPLKRKARAQADYYDMGDDFIDDTDNIAAIESAEHSKRLHTKHGGYFVSSGELEVSESRATPGTAKDGPSRREGTSTVEPVVGGVGCVGVSAAKPPPPSQPVVQEGEEGGVVEQPWLAPSDVQEAMKVFATRAQDHLAARGKGKGPLKTFPGALERPLDELDRKVLAAGAACNSSIHKLKASRYLAALCSALGGEVPLVTIKAALTRLRSAHEAARLSGEVQTLSAELALTIREHIKEVTAPSPSVTTDSSASLLPITEPQASTANGDGGGYVGSFSEERRGEGAEGEASLPPPLPVQWKWTCRWNLSLRGQVCDLERLCVQWVEAENNYRANLKAVHKKSMEEGQVCSGSRVCVFYWNDHMYH